MNVLAAAQDHTLWEIVLAVGIVVVLAVIVLMRRLMSFLKAYEAQAAQLVKLGEQVAANVAPLEQPAAPVRAAPPALEAPAQARATSQPAPALVAPGREKPPGLTAMLRELLRRRGARAKRRSLE